MIKMIDLYNRTLSISPASCFDLQLIALFCMFLLILSVPSNSILVIALCSKKHLKKPYNILLFSFSLICLFGSVSELPIVIISNWECGSIVIKSFFRQTYVLSLLILFGFLLDGSLEIRGVK